MFQNRNYIVRTTPKSSLKICFMNPRHADCIASSSSPSSCSSRLESMWQMDSSHEKTRPKSMLICAAIHKHRAAFMNFYMKHFFNHLGALLPSIHDWYCTYCTYGLYVQYQRCTVQCTAQLQQQYMFCMIYSTCIVDFCTCAFYCAYKHTQTHTRVNASCWCKCPLDTFVWHYLRPALERGARGGPRKDI